MSESQKRPKAGGGGAGGGGSGENSSNKQQPPIQTVKSGEASKPATSQAAEGQKSKADLRRERREIQEAQRAKKAGEGPGSKAAAPGSGGGKKPDAGSQAKPATDTKKLVENKPSVSQQAPKEEGKKQQQSILSSEPAAAAAATAANIKEERRPSVSKPKLDEGKKESGEGLPRNDSFVTAPVILKLNKKRDSQDQPSSGGKENESSGGKLKLFHHFEKYSRDYSAIEKFNIDNPPVHPAFIKLGLQSAHETINGSNSRCLAFLNAFKKFLHDYKPPSNDKRPIPDDLEHKLKLNLNFLTQCRPLCISMGNAIKELKQVITHLPKDISESEAKEILNDEVDKFIHEKILLAAETISKYMLAHSDIIISGTSYAKSKITNDDCLMVYGSSSLVTYILLEASLKFPDMHVVVVDSRPKYKGKQTVEKLVRHGIKCTYVMINAISFIMNKVTKVLLGAHALLANNYVVSTIGTAQIALVAKSFNVPVVVCCETYKFCDKVQTDALVNNELSNPLDLLTTKTSTGYFSLPPSSIDGGGGGGGGVSTTEPTATGNTDNSATTTTTSSQNNVTLLNLTYDVTPPDLITCVVTDMGMLPCTSVPVVLRLKNRDLASLTAVTSRNKNQAESDKNI